MRARRQSQHRRSPAHRSRLRDLSRLRRHHAADRSRATLLQPSAILLSNVMNVPLTPTIIMLGLCAAESNACTGTALPINLSHRESHPFQLWRLTQSCRTALEHRQCARTNRLPLAATKPTPTSTISGPLPLSP